MSGETPRQLKDKLEELIGDDRLSIAAVAGGTASSTPTQGLWTFVDSISDSGQFSYVDSVLNIALHNKDGIDWQSFFETYNGLTVMAIVQSSTTSTILAITGVINIGEGFAYLNSTNVLIASGSFAVSEVAGISITAYIAGGGEGGVTNPLFIPNNESPVESNIYLRDNGEVTWSINVDPSNEDAIGDSVNSAYKFGFMTNSDDGYDGFHIQSIPMGAGTWSGSFTIFTMDNNGNIVLASDGSGTIEAGTYTLPNMSQLKVGGFDNGLGADNGISLLCTVGYELNWQAGHLSSWAGSNQPLYVDSVTYFDSDGVQNGYGTFQASIRNGNASEVGLELNNYAAGGLAYNIFASSNASGIGGGLFVIASETNSQPLVVINATGQVGINTDDPGHQLEVRGDTYTNQLFLQAATNAGNVLEIHDPSDFSNIFAASDYQGNLSFPTYNIYGDAATFDSPAIDVARLSGGDYVWLQGNNSQNSNTIAVFNFDGSTMANVDSTGSYSGGPTLTTNNPVGYNNGDVQATINLLGHFWSESGAQVGSSIISYKDNIDGNAGTALTFQTVDVGNNPQERLRIDKAGVFTFAGDSGSVIFSASASNTEQFNGALVAQHFSPNLSGTTIFDSPQLDVGRIFANDFVWLQGDNSQNNNKIVSFVNNDGDEVANINQSGWLDGPGVNINNGSVLQQGSFDTGRGGNFGISLLCTVGYELNWQAGRLSNYSSGIQTLYVDSPIELDNQNLSLFNYNNSSEGNQQQSPFIIWGGQGWETNGPGSQSVSFRASVLPIEGADSPTGLWRLEADINSNGFSQVFSVSSDGNVIAAASIGVGGSPDASAALDIQSTTQGFLPPRMATTDKISISSPAEGLVVYDTTLHKLSVYTGAGWETVTSI